MRADRRLLAPEVIQISALDCGPAALKALAEGFGIPVAYGRLREACQTGVDGTSIDAVESVARMLGLDDPHDHPRRRRPAVGPRRRAPTLKTLTTGAHR